MSGYDIPVFRKPTRHKNDDTYLLTSVELHENINNNKKTFGDVWFFASICTPSAMFHSLLGPCFDNTTSSQNYMLTLHSCTCASPYTCNRLQELAVTPSKF